MEESKDFKTVIKEYLDKMARRDGYFAQAYHKKHKNLDECVSYIMGEVAKKGSGAICVPDEEVYGMAVHYYEEDSIKDVKPFSGGYASGRRKVELTDEEREKLKEEAKREYKEQVKKELEDARPANSTAENVEQVKVPSMFDF